MDVKNIAEPNHYQTQRRFANEIIDTDISFNWKHLLCCSHI